MSAIATTVVSADEVSDVTVHRNDTDLPVVVEMGQISLHLTDKAAGRLIDELVEQVRDYAPF